MSSKWQFEDVNEGTVVGWRLQKLFHSSKSEFQAVDVMELSTLGRCLVLDGKMQSAEADEYIYHETLVQPAMLCHPEPKTVFIGGGGEGATAREVLRFKSVEKVVMVDIDEVALQTSKDHLPGHHKGAFEDPRLELHIADAKRFLEEYEGTFDVIVFDLADPIPGGPCYLLYTVGYYQTALSKLSPGGVIVTQSGPAGPTSCMEVFGPVNSTLRTVFKEVAPFMNYVPSFCDSYGFNIASQTINPHSFTAEQVDLMLKERLGEEGAAANKYYDGETHVHLFNLPRDVRTQLALCKTIITPENPAYHFTSMGGVSQ
jgi:spermidine synthase